jgi:hypothetical protein
MINYLFASTYLCGASVIGVLERMRGEGFIPEQEEDEPDASAGGD